MRGEGANNSHFVPQHLCQGRQRKCPRVLCQTQKTVQASTTKNRLGHKTETAQITTFTKQKMAFLSHLRGTHLKSAAKHKHRDRAQ